MNRALDGDAPLPAREALKALDLTRVLAGQFATMGLADLGADVVKSEPLPDGESSRRPPPLDGEVGRLKAASVN